MPDAVTYTARWVFPVSQPPLERGTVRVEGTNIAAVEPHGTRVPDVDLGNVAVIPGLVNCHTHLDLSGARGKIPPTDPDHFTDWLRGVIAYRRTRSPDEVQADIRTGLGECLRYGTTLLGDITATFSNWHTLLAPEMRVVLFHELIGVTPPAIENADHLLIEQVHWWLPTALTRAGFSPHAPYSVHTNLMRHIRERAVRYELPIATHLAESPAELELVASRTGPFRAFLEQLGIWTPEAVPSDLSTWVSPITNTAPDLYVHANYLSEAQAFPTHAAIVYCPRTHAAFGHPRHPFREFQQRGVRVALGTDSLASNPDLDLLAEARFVHLIRPEVPCDELLRMATLTGAEALGWADETGSLEAGKSADFVTLPVANRDAADPHDLIFGEDFPTGDRRTMFRGRWRE